MHPILYKTLLVLYLKNSYPPDTKKTIIFSYLPNFSFHQWCQQFGKVLQFIMILSVWWSSKIKIVSVISEISVIFYLKIEVKDFMRWKWIHEKISNPEVAPFHPPNPGRNQGRNILNQIRRVFCDTYLKDMLQFRLWVLCARRSGLKDFMR